MSATLLTVDDLQVRIASRNGEVRAVDGLGFAVGEAEIVAIVGESGSGKSMTALSLLGLAPRDAAVSGSVRFEGGDLLRLPDRKLAAIRGNRIGMVFQEPMTSLNPVLTIGEQIAEVLRWHKGLRWSAARRQAIAEIESVGIAAPATRVKQYPHQMSGGMRQRAMIAMALACRPRLLIADEPTTALDVTVQAQILALMRRLRHERGSAILLITHDLGVVAGMADRVVVMYAGRKVEEGPVASILEAPRHPYTQALLAAAPRLGSANGADVPPRLHEMPSAARADVTTGCAFASRCERVFERCLREAPAVATIAPGRSASCHRLQTTD